MTWPISKASQVLASYGDCGPAKRQSDGSWKFAVTREKDERYEILGNAFSICSDTIAVEKNMPSTSAMDKYLKKVYPDVYLPSTLLSDCVHEQALYQSPPSSIGNLLAVGEARGSTAKRRNCLIHVQSVAKKEIGISGVCPANKGLALLQESQIKVSGKTVTVRAVTEESITTKSFPCSIRDVQFAVDPFGFQRRTIADYMLSHISAIIILQTTTEVFLYQINYKPSDQVALHPVLHISQELLQDQVPACAAVNLWNDYEIAIISTTGTLFLWRAALSTTAEPVCFCLIENVIHTNDGWSRVTWGCNQLDLVIVTKSIIYVLGIESKNIYKIYELNDSNEVCNFFLSRSVQDSFLFLVTLSEVVWIDMRAPKVPLLAWKHYRANDNTLSLQVHHTGRVFSLFLCSQIVPIVLVFQGSFIDMVPQCTASPHLVQIPDTFIASSLLSFSRSLVAGAEAFENDDTHHALLGFYYMTQDLGIHCIVLQKTCNDRYSQTLNENSVRATKMTHSSDEHSDDEESVEHLSQSNDSDTCDLYLGGAWAHQVIDFTKIQKEILSSIDKSAGIKPNIVNETHKGNVMTLYETTTIQRSTIEAAQESIEKVISYLVSRDIELVSLGLDNCSTATTAEQQIDPDIDIWSAENIYKRLLKLYIDTRSNIPLAKRKSLMLEARSMAVDMSLASIGFIPNGKSLGTEHHPALQNLTLLCQATTSDSSFRDIVMGWNEESPNFLTEASPERLVMSSQPRPPSPLHSPLIPRVFLSESQPSSVPELNMTQPERGMYGSRLKKKKKPRKSEGFR